MVEEQLSGEQCRHRTIAVVDSLISHSAELALGQPPEAVRQLREKLVGDQYCVLVVGEAKRGKSSFVNALIGRRELPTDAGYATNQAFRVRPGRGGRLPPALRGRVSAGDRLGRSRRLRLPGEAVA